MLPIAASSDNSDAALVHAAQAGDAGALAVLLARHRPLLLGLCRHALRDPVLAEDAVQEASLQALLHLARLRHPERFRFWLAGIALNICRMWLRQRVREGLSWNALHDVIEHAGPRAGLDSASLVALVRRAVLDRQEAHDPSRAAETADLAAAVRRAVAGLPAGQQAAVLLFYLSGLSYAETATLLGIEVGAVRTRLHKARRALRQPLRLFWEEEPMTTDAKQIQYRCTFCGKKNEDVERLIAGPPHLGGSAICAECVARCSDLIAAARAKASA